jgi:hypothetical protein
MEETTTSPIENVTDALNDRLTAMEARISENEGNIASLGILAFVGVTAAALTGLAIWTAIDNDRIKHRQLENRVDRIVDVQSENVTIANDNWEKVSKREKTIARTLEIVGGKKTEKAFEKAVAEVSEDDYNPFKKARQPRKW